MCTHQNQNRGNVSQSQHKPHKKPDRRFHNTQKPYDGIHKKTALSHWQPKTCSPQVRHSPRSCTCIVRFGFLIPYFPSEASPMPLLLSVHLNTGHLLLSWKKPGTATVHNTNSYSHSMVLIMCINLLCFM